MFRTALVPAKPPIHWASWFFLRDKAARMWSWPSPTCNVKVKNKWSYTSVPCTFLHGMDRRFTPLLLTWHTLIKKMHTAGLVRKPEGKRPPGRPSLRCHHLRMVLLCLYCNMSPVEMGASAPNCSMLSHLLRPCLCCNISATLILVLLCPKY
jgi:hypothetical protein